MCEPSSAPLARRAARLLEGEEQRIEKVSSQLGVTPPAPPSSVSRRTSASAPKDFARAARLQRAVRMATTSSDWVRIATDAGYYDQAHLSADFRDLVGLTPSAFSKRAYLREPGTAPLLTHRLPVSTDPPHGATGALRPRSWPRRPAAASVRECRGRRTPRSAPHPRHRGGSFRAWTRCAPPCALLGACFLLHPLALLGQRPRAHHSRSMRWRARTSGSSVGSNAW